MTFIFVQIFLLFAVFSLAQESNLIKNLGAYLCAQAQQLDMANSLNQAWATSGPWATCGPPSTLIWPGNFSG